MQSLVADMVALRTHVDSSNTATNVAVASQGWPGGMGSARSALKTRLLLRTQSLVILVPPTQQQHLSQTTVTVLLGFI